MIMWSIADVDPKREAEVLVEDQDSYGEGSGQ